MGDIPVQYHNHVFMSRKHVRDVEAPVLPHDVAIKQYVDDRAQPPNNEVEIGGAPPRDQLVELWVDEGTDVAGSTGADEVFIQNDEPTEATAELWLDLDEPTPTDEGEVIISATEPAVFELWVDISNPITSRQMVDQVGGIIAPLYAELDRLRAEIAALRDGG